MGRKAIDLTGQKFGRLIALDRMGADQHGHPLWQCRCVCGKITLVPSHALTSGNTQSCGCLKIDKSRISGKQSAIHNGRGTRLYNIWKSMKARCGNPNHHAFCNYGGRGITICPEWLHDFAAFRDWALSHGYQDDLSIDRINNDGNYEPGNCRWATMKEQRINQRPRKREK